MRVIPPIQVTDLTLTSSSCNEPHSTEQAYNSGTTYAKGAKVIVGAPSSTVTVGTGANRALRLSCASVAKIDGTAVRSISLVRGSPCATMREPGWMARV